MYTNLPMPKKSTPKKASVQPVILGIGVENLLEISQKNITENRSMLLLTNGPLLVKEPTFYKNFPVLDTLSIFTIGKLEHVSEFYRKQKKALSKIRKILAKTNKTNTPQIIMLTLATYGNMPPYARYVITLQGGIMRNYNTSEVERESAKSIHSITINPTDFLIKLGESNDKNALGGDVYCTMNDAKCTYIIEYRKILKIEEITLSEEQYTSQGLKLKKEFEEFIYSNDKSEKEKKNEFQKRDVTNLSQEILEEIKAIPVIIPENLLEISQENITENRSMLILAKASFSVNKAQLKKALQFFVKHTEEMEGPQDRYVSKKTKILSSLAIFSLSDFKMLKPKKALLDIKKFIEEKNIIQKVGMLSISNEKIYRITFQDAGLQDYDDLEYIVINQIHCITIYKTGFLIYPAGGKGNSHNVLDPKEYIVGDIKYLQEEQHTYFLDYSKILKIEEIPSLHTPFILEPPFTAEFCEAQDFPYCTPQDLVKTQKKNENSNLNLLILTILGSKTFKEELHCLLPKHLRNPDEATINTLSLLELGNASEEDERYKKIFVRVMGPGEPNRGLRQAMYFLQKIVYNYFQIAIDRNKKYLITFESAQLCTYNFTIEHTPILGQSHDFFQHELKSILLTREDIKAYSQEEKEIFNSNAQLKKATIIIEYKKILEITELPDYLAYSPKPYFTLT